MDLLDIAIKTTTIAAGDAGTTLWLGVLSGTTAIVVAFIGYLGIKHRNQEEPPPPVAPVPGADDEPLWVRELRRDLAHERAINGRHEDEIERLQRLLYLNRIDPTDGTKLGAKR